MSKTMNVTVTNIPSMDSVELQAAPANEPSNIVYCRVETNDAIREWCIDLLGDFRDYCAMYGYSVGTVEHRSES